MKQDEIIEMARQAGIVFDDKAMPYYERFAKLVAAKEREACAKVAQKTVCDTHIPTGVKISGTAAAKAIRARGEA